MNRVYKVIWSKAKHCYVVTSEIARSVTKSASSARSAGRKGAAVLAMAALLFTAGGVLGEAANVTDITVNDKGNVITVTKDVGDPTPITIDNVAHATEAVHATAADRATRDGNGVVIDTNYVKKADAEVDVDGPYVKVANTVGQNLSALNAQVKKNTDAVAAEETARKTADQNNLKVGNDGVISQVTGDDGTTSSAVKTLVLNKDGDNQITMDEKGIKVGKNSTVIASDGVFAGGDTATDAKAALNANGSIKGANGKFTVDANGQVTANGGVDTNSGDILTRGGKINAGSGDISGKDISASGDISGKDITGSGTVKGHAVTDGTARMEGGALTGVTTITAGGDVVSTGGKVQGTSVSDGTATLSGGSLNNAVDINASGTITGNNVVVKGKLTTNGLETDRITLGSETLNQTDINKGNVTSKVNDTVGAVEYTAESIFNKDGSSITARTDEGIVDSTGKSIVGAKEISQYLGNNAEPKSSDKNVTRKMVRNDDGTFSMEDTAVDEGKSSTVSQNAGERKVTVAEGTKNLNVTENLTNGIVSETKGDDGTVTLTQGMDGTYKVETSGTSTEEIGGKKIENYKGGLDTNITGDETHVVDGAMTTTVTGDSSLTAENITNEAKNKITNKAIDVETDATSSIVQKVTNDAGSNTSTQWSYQTTEEMKADGKTASYLRGAAEEKSQLTNGAKKTTIDTVAGQTNTNITDGTNTSNDLQKADQIASSVTDGTNKTVVNQDARSLASSITAGTKFNNTNNTVDKSEQQIRASDTQFSATSKTATKMEDALVSGGSVIDVMKNLDDAANPFIGSAVTDGTNITVVTQTAKDITNTAEEGTIANNAKDITNNATENMTNTVGKNLETTVGGEMKTTVTGNVTEDFKADLSTKVGGDETHAVTGNQTTTVSGNRTVNVKGTETENFNAQVTNVKTDQKTSVGGNQTNIVTGNQQNTVSGSKTETVKKAVTEKYGSQATTVDGDQSTNVGGNQSNVVKGNQTNTISGNKTETVKGEVTEKYGSLTTEVKGESKLSAANITNSAKEKLSNSAADIENIASKSITDKVGDNVERTMTTEQIQDKVGKTTVTTTDGLTKLTDEDHNHTTEMDYANVTKDLSVERNTTLGKEGEDTNLTVNSKSEFKDTVKMDSTLEVDRTSKFNDKVTITQNGLAVTGGTTTDTLKVEKTSEFGGKAAFKDDVSMGKNLSVGGNLNVDGNIETHDAVLSADSRQVVTGRQLYQTNERVDRLDNRIKKVGANAAALAALRPGDFNPDDKFSIAAGFGSYRNANAAALGLFYRPNENVLLSLGTSFGDGENMVNAGVSVKFGRGKSMAERRKEMADEVSSMRDEMRSQDERIAELEEMLKKQSELIEKLSKES